MPDEMRDYLEQRERTLEARVAELKRALVLARCGLAEGHEAAVRKGKAVHWDILEQRLRTAHDAASSALKT